MERNGEKIRYSSVNLLQDILSFLIKKFLSFPNLVKIFFDCLLHSKQGHGFTPIYPYLRTKTISSSCTYDFDQDPLVEPHKKGDHPCKTHCATIDTASFSESLGRDIQRLSDRECPLVPSQLVSWNSTATEQSAAISLCPTTIELTQPSSSSSATPRNTLILSTTPASTPLGSLVIAPTKAKRFAPLLLLDAIHDLP